MNKTALLIFFFLSFFVLSSKFAFASVIFEDDFSNGTSKWTPLQDSWIVNQGRYGSTVGSGSIHTMANVSINVPDYMIELDLLPVQGVDRNIPIRWNDNNPLYEFHFNSDGGGIWHFLNNHVLSPIQFNQIQKIKIILEGTAVKFYVDDVLLIDTVVPAYNFDGSDQFGLRVGTGSVLTEVYFDNVVISTLDDEGETSLNVPLLKQTDPLWGSQVYDTADVWSNSGTGISQWGCAMTSAAMVFKYHGINTLPDGTTPLDPGTLNSWLKSQSDGYVSGGLVNWLALSRLSRLAPHTGGGVFDALEYSRVGGTNIAQLSSDLQDGIPDILEEPGHFIVAKGETDTSFAINDPYYARELLSDYGNTFVSLRQFKPSLTDLSYLMFVVDEDVDIHLFDSESNEIGEQYIQEPITDPSGQASTNGGSVKMLHFQKPDSGQYTVVISSNTSNAYVLQSYEYDENGNVKQGSFSGVVGNGNSDTYLLNFSKENSNNSTVEPYVTFSSLKNDIKTYYSLGKIKKYVVYKLLLLKVELAENLSRHSKRATKALLTIVKAEIQKEKGKSITTDAANSLLGQLGILTAQY